MIKDFFCKRCMQHKPQTEQSTNEHYCKVCALSITNSVVIDTSERLTTCKQVDALSLEVHNRKADSDFKREIEAINRQFSSGADYVID